MNNEKIILETQDLTHVFSDGTVGISRINLQVREGDFMVISGANGSGKSVLMRHLNGLLKPTSGVALLEGRQIHKNLAEARRRVGLIFQNSDSQFVGQTVAEDVAFGLENLKVSRDEIEKITDEILGGVGLKNYEFQSPHHLSGGQKRKLAVAGVLVMKPDVVIFDEPFTGLDFCGVKQVLKELMRLHQMGQTVIVVTHELEKVLAHATRLVVMHEKEVVLDGPPEQIIHEITPYNIRMPLKTGEKVASLTWLT